MNAKSAPVLAVAQASKPVEQENSARSVRLFLYSNDKYTPKATLKPFPKSFTGGLRVGFADIDGDFKSELVVGTGPGGSIGPIVKIYSFDNSTAAINKTSIQTLKPFSNSYNGGVNIASGYFTPDFRQELVFGGAKRSSEVEVFNIGTQSTIFDFDAFDSSLKGGVNVAAGDLNGDGFAEIVVGAGAGGGPHVKVYNGTTGSQLTSAIGGFLAYDSTFNKGVNVAVGDVNGDGRADIITSQGKGGTPQVKVFSGVDGSLSRSFFAYPQSFKGGVNVATGDVNGDGFSDIIVAPASGKQTVNLIDSKTETQVDSFYPFGRGWTGGVIVYQF